VLRSLELFDFAIADRVSVELGAGLNVLSGETGAGKSLLVDALALLAGGRADVGVVRSGRASALVQATWTDGPSLTVARRVVREGRNLARIDGEVVTVAELQSTLAPRLGIFGQHAYQTLLDGAEQRAMLDRRLDPAAAAAWAAYRSAWAERQEVRERLAALRSAVRDRARALDLLRYQVDEIDAARLRAGEDADLDARLEALRHLERVRSGVVEALSALAAIEGSAADRLTEAVRALSAAARHDASLRPLQGELADAATAVQAIAGELETALERLEAEPGELDRLEARRAEIEALERKYGAGVEGVLRMRAALAAELDGLARADADDADLARRDGELTDVIERTARTVGEGRRRVAAELAPAVVEVLRALALPHARFEVELQPLPEPGPSGAERVAFRFGANLGEPLGGLRDVASGGELSRVMLALHAAAGSDVPRSCSTRSTRGSAAARAAPSARCSRVWPATGRCSSSRTSPRWRPSPTTTCGSTRPRRRVARSRGS
jgi:DNA repair protein RecN (Recombination protein N)